MLVARKDGQAGVRVVADAGVERRDDPETPEGKSVRLPDGGGLLALPTRELRCGSLPRSDIARLERRRGADALSHRRPGQLPEEPPDRIPAVTRRRRLAHQVTAGDRVAQPGEAAAVRLRWVMHSAMDQRVGSDRRPQSAGDTSAASRRRRFSASSKSSTIACSCGCIDRKIPRGGPRAQYGACPAGGAARP